MPATTEAKALLEAKRLINSVIEELDETDFSQEIEEQYHAVINQRKNLCIAYLNLCFAEIENFERSLTEDKVDRR